MDGGTQRFARRANWLELWLEGFEVCGRSSTFGVLRLRAGGASLRMTDLILSGTKSVARFNARYPTLSR